MWFGLKELEYQQNNDNYTVFFKHTTTILLVYVDDMIIKDDDKEEIPSVTGQFTVNFEIKLLGELHYFLDIEAAYSRQGIHLS